MLGPTKWRLLTIVASILLAHAIDSASRSSRSLSQQTPSQSVTTIQRILPWHAGGAGPTGRPDTRVARNLYTPYKRFSNVDNVRYIETQPIGGDWQWKTTFGAFRYAPRSQDMRRRSDGEQQQYQQQLMAQVAISELGNSTAYPLAEALVATTARMPVQVAPLRRPRYRFIPLRPAVNAIDDASATLSDNDDSTEDDEEGEEVDRSVNINHYQRRPSTQITFATDATAETPSDLKGRRSGIQFTAQSPTYGSLFMPQSYQEDNPSHPNFQSPYSEELSTLTGLGDGEPETRQTRGANYNGAPSPLPPHRTTGGIAFPGSTSSTSALTSTKVTYPDDVTKFGDVNGPITVHRQFNDFLNTQGFRSYDNYYYQDDYRHPRHYFPPKAFVEYSDYPGPPRQSRLIVPWKSSRTPRVVFPQNDGGFGTGSGSYSTNNDIVFRYVAVTHSIIPMPFRSQWSEVVKKKQTAKNIIYREHVNICIAHFSFKF